MRGSTLIVETVQLASVVKGSELSPSQFGELLEILRANWEDTDPYLDDIARVIRNAGEDMLVRIVNGRIDGVLRTKPIRADGDPRRVPATFEQLVGSYWSRRDPDADTRILVDLTKREGATGVANTLIPESLGRFPEANFGTFSPESAVGLHLRLGAQAVRCIPDGRPRRQPPNVVVMAYRGFALQN